MKMSRTLNCNNCHHRKVCTHKVEFEMYRNALYATVGSFRPFFNVPKLESIDYFEISLDCKHHSFDMYAAMIKVKEREKTNEHDD